MSEPIRLDKRLAEQIGCSRAQAQQYIEGGWVRVDGRTVEEPQTPVSAEAVELDAAARDAVQRARFKPVLRDGVAEPAWGVVPIEFRLDRA